MLWSSEDCDAIPQTRRSTVLSEVVFGRHYLVITRDLQPAETQTRFFGITFVLDVIQERKQESSDVNPF